MRRVHVGALATLVVAMAHAESLPEPPPAVDEKPVRRQRSSYYASSTIPFPHLHHVSRETLNRPPSTRTSLQRLERRARRKRRMQLRKRMGWR